MTRFVHRFICNSQVQEVSSAQLWFFLFVVVGKLTFCASVVREGLTTKCYISAVRGTIKTFKYYWACLFDGSYMFQRIIIIRVHHVLMKQKIGLIQKMMPFFFAVKNLSRKKLKSKVLILPKDRWYQQDFKFSMPFRSLFRENLIIW